MIYNDKVKEFRKAKQKVGKLDRATIVENIYNDISSYASVKFTTKCMMVEPKEDMSQDILVNKIHESIHKNIEKTISGSMFGMLRLSNGTVLIETRG